MKKNMGSIDRGIRIAIAITVGILYYADIISGTLAIVLGIFSIIFLLTSFIGYCPLYKPLGIKTTCGSCEKDKVKE